MTADAGGRAAGGRRRARAGLVAGIAAAAIVLAALALGTAFDDGAGYRAVAVSAGVAAVVQAVAFALVRGMGSRNVMAARGLGMLLRFVVLGVYGLLTVRAWGLAPTAALLSLGAFFFVSILIEPWLVRV